MKEFPWSSEYETGLKEIDRQHQELLTTLNQLAVEIKKGEGNQVVSQTLLNLFSYTKSHFAYEENLFNKSSYADAENHMKEHQSFIAQIEGFRKDLQQGEVTLSAKVYLFLQNWLMDHILKSDQAYVAHIKEE